MIQQSLTPAQFAKCKTAVAQQAGIDLQGDSGTISHDGVTVSYHYDGTTSQLTLEIKHKPMLMPQALIESKIRGWFSTEA